MSDPAFPCEKCGACCRVLTQKMAEITGLPLSKTGQGCAHQDEKNLCTKYEGRPILCDVRKMFALCGERVSISWDEFIEQNRAACRVLQAREAH